VVTLERALVKGPISKHRLNIDSIVTTEF